MTEKNCQPHMYNTYFVDNDYTATIKGIMYNESRALRAFYSATVPTVAIIVAPHLYHNHLFIFSYSGLSRLLL